jgi:hypothetical protein
MMHPLGCARLIAFEVHCRGYGVTPTVDLFRSLCTVGPAGDWLTFANKPNVECFLKGGLDIRDWRDEFVFMDVRLLMGHEVLYDPSNRKVRKRGEFKDSAHGVLSAELLRMRSVLLEGGILVESYPEGILFRAGIARRLAEGEKEYDGMTKYCIL